MKYILPIAIVGLIAGAAQADVTVTLDVKGYDDFFDKCEIKLLTVASPGIQKVSALQRIRVAEKGGSMCLQHSSGFNCQATDDFEYTCDDMKNVEVLGVQCEDGGGNAVACGAVTIGKTIGDDIPAVVPDLTGDPGATTQIFAAVLGNDTFFNSCKIGTSYISTADIDYAAIKYRIDVGDKGHSNCTGSASQGISSGLSCSSSGPFDYTCADVTAVKVESVTCEKDDAEVDCGSVSVRTPQPDLIESGL